MLEGVELIRSGCVGKSDRVKSLDEN